MSGAFTIPFVDLKAQDEELREEIKNAIDMTLDESVFVRGKSVAKFEKDFGALFGKEQHVVSTGNGTDSLFISLKMLGVGPGDEVLTPAVSWISTAETISLCGARPVFCDIEPGYHTICPVDLQKKITSKTRAIIVVHLFGQAGALDEILQISQQHNLHVIEDCAQAHLTSYRQKHVGTFGNTGCFSFYPTKNLGAYGDAGCVITRDYELATRIRRFANHGALHKDDHTLEGINSRLDTVQAAILSVKMKHLTKWNQTREKHARMYGQILSEVGALSVPIVRPEANHTFHIYSIQTERRDELQKHLASNGIQTLVHYPQALAGLSVYRHLTSNSSTLVNAMKFQDTCLSLPIHPALKETVIEFIADKVKGFF